MRQMPHILMDCAMVLAFPTFCPMLSGVGYVLSQSLVSLQVSFKFR